MERLPIGTRVRYHGSIRSYHGEYEITGYSDLTRPPYDKPEILEHYTQGYALDLWPVGVPRKFCERDKALYFVRPESVTPILGERCNPA